VSAEFGDIFADEPFEALDRLAGEKGVVGSTADLVAGGWCDVL
jgi:hypothetical protein